MFLSDITDFNFLETNYRWSFQYDIGEEKKIHSLSINAKLFMLLNLSKKFRIQLASDAKESEIKR